MRYRAIKIAEPLYNILMEERGPRKRDKGTGMTSIILRHFSDEELIEKYVCGHFTADELDFLRPGLREQYKHLVEP